MWSNHHRKVVERVGLCSEGWQFNPRPCQMCNGRRFLGQDTLPRVNEYDCCMFEVVVGGAEGGEWQPRFRQSATVIVYHHQYDCVGMNQGLTGTKIWPRTF